MIGGIIDKTIEAISPRWGYQRKFYRELNQRQSRYAASKTTRLSGAWTSINQDVNTLIGEAAPTVRARVRQLVRDFPYFSRAVSALSDFTVGDGIIFQSRIETPDGKINKEISQKIEDAFKFWCDEADFAKWLHYYEMMSLAKTQDSECGEFIIIKRNVDDGRYLPFSLQMVESEWLTDENASGVAQGNKLAQGIETDPITGEAVAYHFTDPDSWGKSMRVLASDVIHGFKTLRPNQLRGISIFTPAILVAHDLSDYMDAEIDAAKMAAKYLAFIKTADPYSRQLSATTDETTGLKTEDFENAILEYLRPGEDITIASNPRPGTNFPAFVKLILQMVAVTGGIPYEILSGDYGNINYSTAKVIRNDFAQAMKPIAGRHVRQFCTKTLIPFLETAVMSQKLNLPGFMKNPIPYMSCEWQPPGMESVDPLKETKAYIDQMEMGLRSPQEIARSRGRDLETIYREIAAAKEMADEFGLTFTVPSTAIANNPDAIEDQE